MKNQLVKVEPKPLQLSRFLINPYGNHMYRFDVGMPVDKLVEKLKQDNAGMMSLDMMMRRKPFYGTVGGDSFNLTWLQMEINNSWTPVAVGRMLPMGDRTRVDVTFRLNSLVQMFFLIWILGIVFAAVALVGRLDFRQPMTLIPILLPIFGIALSIVGPLFGRSEQAKFLKYFDSLPDSTYVEQTKLIE